MEDDEQNIQQPLLEHSQCPGCTTAYLRDKDAPIPYKHLVRLGFVILANALPISVVYPFFYFMIKDLHVTDKEEDIGYYAGWIGSSFMLGRVTTGIIWGSIADRHGRKVVMYCGIISIIVFNTLFGLSTNFWMALLTRFFLGSFNGMLGTVKAYASEICSEKHQAIGLSLVSTVWGFGLIVGPALGGYLAQPAVKYPNIFKPDNIFARYPYFLQALGVLVFTVPAIIMCIYLPETLHNHHIHDHGKETDQDSVSSEDHTTVSINEEENEVQRKATSIFKNWPFISSTIVYCLWSLHDIAYTEIFSLWAVSPRSYGGLSFSSSEVGRVLAVSGFVMLIFQLIAFPLFERWLGPILITRIPAILTVPILSVYPFLTHLHGTWLWVVLFTLSIFRIILGQSTFTGTFLLINNSVEQNQRGAANGVSLSLVSVFKAIGPAAGGAVFAWCQTRQKASFLPGDHLVFFFLNIFALLAGIMTFKPLLPESTNKPLAQ